MTDRRYEAAVVVGALTRALTDGSRDLRTVPALLVRVINEDLWQERIDPDSGRVYRFDSWIAFVEARAPMGLGSSQPQLEGLCTGNSEALEALDRALKKEQPHGGDRSGQSKTDNINLDPPDGTSRAQALRRLRKDRPDLLARVLADELSPHGAMVEAGFRKRNVTISADNPERIAATLRRRLDPDTLDALVKLLTKTALPQQSHGHR